MCGCIYTNLHWHSLDPCFLEDSHHSQLGGPGILLEQWILCWTLVPTRFMLYVCIYNKIILRIFILLGIVILEHKKNYSKNPKGSQDVSKIADYYSCKNSYYTLPPCVHNVILRGTSGRTHRESTLQTNEHDCLLCVQMFPFILDNIDIRLYSTLNSPFSSKYTRKPNNNRILLRSVFSDAILTY